MIINTALETIDFQKDDFGKQIEKNIDKAIDYLKTRSMFKLFKDNKLQEIADDLERLIYLRTGLSIVVDFEHDAVAAILRVPFNNHHVFGSDNILTYLIRKKTEIPESSIIDLNKAKISGGFSRIKNYLYLNIKVLHSEYKLSSSEITAVILHEVGHAFTFFEYSDRLQSTNQIMLTLSETLKKDPKSPNRVFLYKKLDEVLESSGEKFEHLSDENNRYLLAFKIFKIYTKTKLFKKISQMAEDKYDETTSEQLADSFASRFGYGKYLVTSLDKLGKMHILTQILTSTIMILNFIRTTINIIKDFLASPGTMALILIALFIWKLFQARESGLDYTYDNTTRRYKRIRSQYITMISTLKLENDELKDIIQSVEEIDAIMKNLPKEKTPIMTIIANFIFFKNLDVKKDVQFQQLLEDLAHNDLFLQSAKLRTLKT